MDIKKGVRPAHARTRRIGKKVIICSRLAHALDSMATWGAPVGVPQQQRQPWLQRVQSRAAAFQPSKKQVALFMFAIFVALTSVAGVMFYHSQKAAAAHAAAVAKGKQAE